MSVMPNITKFSFRSNKHTPTSSNNSKLISSINAISTLENIQVQWEGVVNCNYNVNLLSNTNIK